MKNKLRMILAVVILTPLITICVGICMALEWLDAGLADWERRLWEKMK